MKLSGNACTIRLICDSAQCIVPLLNVLTARIYIAAGFPLTRHWNSMTSQQQQLCGWPCWQYLAGWLKNLDA